MSSEEPINRLYDILCVLFFEKKGSPEANKIISVLTGLISLYEELKIVEKRIKNRKQYTDKGLIPIPLPEELYTGTHHICDIEVVTQQIDEFKKLAMQRLKEFDIDFSKIRESIEKDISDFNEDPDTLEIFEDLKDFFSGSDEEIFVKIIEKTKNPGELSYYENYDNTNLK